MKYSLILKNTITLKFQIYNLEDLNENQSLYYRFNIELVDPIDGEYQFYLIENSNWDEIDLNEEDVYESKINDSLVNVLQTGLLRIGDYIDNNVFYTKDNNEYIAYERK